MYLPHLLQASLLLASAIGVTPTPALGAAAAGGTQRPQLAAYSQAPSKEGDHPAVSDAQKGSQEAVEVRKVWDAAPHQAFTDLTRHRDRWLCVFREGAAHVSPDGAIRVLSSEDGRAWRSIARVTKPDADLRDPKIVVAPDGRLMLLAAGAMHPPSKVKHQTYVWFSKDGERWEGPHPIGEPNIWLWRVVWHEGTAYGVGYATDDRRLVRLYTSKDGLSWRVLVDRLFETGFPNESALVFQPDGTALLLLRRDGEDASAQLGTARPPYRRWKWKDLGVQVGGPQMLRLPDGRLLAAVRLYDGQVRTSLAWLDPEAGTLTEHLKLPSGGDTSYAGLVWHEGKLWISYYSSHEGRTSIYVATARLPAGN